MARLRVGRLRVALACLGVTVLAGAVAVLGRAVALSGRPGRGALAAAPPPRHQRPTAVAPAAAAAPAGSGAARACRRPLDPAAIAPTRNAKLRAPPRFTRSSPRHSLYKLLPFEREGGLDAELLEGWHDARRRRLLEFDVVRATCCIFVLRPQDSQYAWVEKGLKRKGLCKGGILKFGRMVAGSLRWCEGRDDCLSKDRARLSKCTLGISNGLLPGWYHHSESAGVHNLMIEKPAIGHYGKTWFALLWDGLNGYSVLPRRQGPERWRDKFGAEHTVVARATCAEDGSPSLCPDGSSSEGTVKDDIILIGQRPRDNAVLPVMRRFGSTDQWVERAAREARARFPGANILYKAHPRETVGGDPYFVPKGVTDITSVPLDDALASARCVVTMNGNVGVDAALEGVPVVTYDPGALVWGFSAHSVDGCACSAVEELDRELAPKGGVQQLFDNLAYTMWTPEELSSGEALAFMFNLTNFR